MFGWFGGGKKSTEDSSPKTAEQPDQAQQQPEYTSKPDSVPEPVHEHVSPSPISKAPIQSGPSKFVPKKTTLSSSKGLFSGMSMKPSTGPASVTPMSGARKPVTQIQPQSTPSSTSQYIPVSIPPMAKHTTTPSSSRVSSFTPSPKSSQTSDVKDIVHDDVDNQVKDESSFGFMNNSNEENDEPITNHDDGEEETQTAFGFLEESDAEDLEHTTAVSTKHTVVPSQDNSNTESISDWDVELSMLSHTISSNYTELASVITECRDLRSQKINVDREIEEFQEKIDSAKSSMEHAIETDDFTTAGKLSSLHDDLQAKLSALVGRSRTLATLISDFDHKIANLVDLSGVDDNLNTMKNLHNLRCDEVKTYVFTQHRVNLANDAQVEKEIQNIDLVLETIEESENSVNQELEQFEAKFEANSKEDYQERASLEMHVEGLESDIDELLRQLAAKQDELAAINVKIDKIDEVLEHRRKECQDEVDEVEERKLLIIGKKKKVESDKNNLIELKSKYDDEKNIFNTNMKYILQDNVHANVFVIIVNNIIKRSLLFRKLYERYLTAYNSTLTIVSESQAKVGQLQQDKVDKEAEILVLQSTETDLLKNITDIDALLPLLNSEKKTAVVSKDFKKASIITTKIGDMCQDKEKSEIELDSVKNQIVQVQSDIEGIDVEIAVCHEEAKTKMVTVDKDMYVTIEHIETILDKAVDEIQHDISIVDEYTIPNTNTNTNTNSNTNTNTKSEHDYQRHASFPNSTHSHSDEDHCIVLDMGRVGTKANDVIGCLTTELKANKVFLSQLSLEKEALNVDDDVNVNDEEIVRILDGIVLGGIDGEIEDVLATIHQRHESLLEKMEDITNSNTNTNTNSNTNTDAVKTTPEDTPEDTTEEPISNVDEQVTEEQELNTEEQEINTEEVSEGHISEEVEAIETEAIEDDSSEGVVENGEEEVVGDVAEASIGETCEDVLEETIEDVTEESIEQGTGIQDVESSVATENTTEQDNVEVGVEDILNVAAQDLNTDIVDVDAIVEEEDHDVNEIDLFGLGDDDDEVEGEDILENEDNLQTVDVVDVLDVECTNEDVEYADQIAAIETNDDTLDLFGLNHDDVVGVSEDVFNLNGDDDDDVVGVSESIEDDEDVFNLNGGDDDNQLDTEHNPIEDDVFGLNDDNDVQDENENENLFGLDDEEQVSVDADVSTNNVVSEECEENVEDCAVVEDDEEDLFGLE